MNYINEFMYGTVGYKSKAQAFGMAFGLTFRYAVFSCLAVSLAMFFICMYLI